MHPRKCWLSCLKCHELVIPVWNLPWCLVPGWVVCPPLAPELVFGGRNPQASRVSISVNVSRASLFEAFVCIDDTRELLLLLSILTCTHTHTRLSPPRLHKVSHGLCQQVSGRVFGVVEGHSPFALQPQMMTAMRARWGLHP